MNFVGHAHVARRVHRDPSILLGSMLPDFASMCGARLVRANDPGVALGVALHHRTDEAFHGSAPFVELCRVLGQSLDRAGLSWGASRAAAHVGIEMLLDGFLLDEPGTPDAVRDGIRALEQHGEAIRLAGPGADHWPAFVARIRAHDGPPDFYRDPVQVADRLMGILARRPRLVVEESRRAALEVELLAIQPEVERARQALVAAASAP